MPDRFRWGLIGRSKACTALNDAEMPLLFINFPDLSRASNGMKVLCPLGALNGDEERGFLLRCEASLGDVAGENPLMRRASAGEERGGDPTGPRSIDGLAPC